MTILIQNARPQGFSDVAGASVDVLVGDDGTIAAVGNGLVAPAGARVIDGTGKTLSPGWMDLHVHVWHGGADIAVRPREAGLATGVTTMLDTGSAGEAIFHGFREYVIDTAPEAIFALINIGSIGCVATNFIRNSVVNL